MSRLVRLSFLVLVTLAIVSTCSAQQGSHWKIDSTTTINEHLCLVVNIHFDEVLHETWWLSNENGSVRQCAYVTYGMGSDTLDGAEFYFVKQYPQVGDTWQLFANGAKDVEVMSYAPITVPRAPLPPIKWRFGNPAPPRWSVSFIGRIGLVKSQGNGLAPAVN